MNELFAILDFPQPCDFGLTFVHTKKEAIEYEAWYRYQTPWIEPRPTGYVAGTRDAIEDYRDAIEDWIDAVHEGEYD